MSISRTPFRWLLVLSFLVAAGALVPKAVRAETRTATALTNAVGDRDAGQAGAPRERTAAEAQRTPKFTHTGKRSPGLE